MNGKQPLIENDNKFIHMREKERSINIDKSNYKLTAEPSDIVRVRLDPERRAHKS
jgi:hypothetical protein